MAPEENLLDNLVLAYPCPIKWEAMEGDERARICSQCSQHVYNISDMTTSEAEKFLSETIKTDDACLLFYVRADGTIKTDNCPRILRPIRNFATCVHKATFLALSVVATAALSACNNSWAQSVLDNRIRAIKQNLQNYLNDEVGFEQTIADLYATAHKGSAFPELESVLMESFIELYNSMSKKNWFRNNLEEF